MFSFPTAIVPLFLIGSLSAKKQPAERFVIPLLLGLISGLAYLILRKLLWFSDTTTIFEFKTNFLSLLKQDSFPFVVFYSLFALITRDSAEYKAFSFHVAVTAFFSVCVPLKVLSSSDGATFFFIFEYPLMVIATIYLFQKGILLLHSSAAKIPVRLAAAASMFLLLSMEPLAETLWMLQISVPAVTAISIFMVSASIAAFVIERLLIRCKPGAETSKDVGAAENANEETYNQSSEITSNLE